MEAGEKPEKRDWVYEFTRLVDDKIEKLRVYVPENIDDPRRYFVRDLKGNEVEDLTLGEREVLETGLYGKPSKELLDELISRKGNKKKKF